MSKWFNPGLVGVALGVLLFLMMFCIFAMVQANRSLDVKLQDACQKLCETDDDHCRRACLAKEVDSVN